MANSVERITGAEATTAHTSPYKDGINDCSSLILSGLDCQNFDVRITVEDHGHILPHAKRRCRTYTYAEAGVDVGTPVNARFLSDAGFDS